MEAKCPYCGVGPHTARKRTYACGTIVNGAGVEYRSQTCLLGEERLHAMNAALAAAEVARQERDLAFSARDTALAEAARDREFANVYHQRLDADMRALRERLLTALSSTIDTEIAVGLVAAVEFDALRPYGSLPPSPDQIVMHELLWNAPDEKQA